LIKQKKGELVVNATKHIVDSECTLIICNETGPSQFLYLMQMYSPLFVTMDFDDSTGKAGLRPIGRIELIGRAMGVVFP
jgi:hypothetical protein